MVVSPAKACDDPRLNRGEVDHHEPVPVGGDESGADELREGVGYVVAEQLDRFKVFGPHEASGLGQVW